MQIRHWFLACALSATLIPLAACKGDQGADAPKADAPTTSNTAEQTAEKPAEVKPEDAAELPFEATGVVAIVNDHEITAARFNAEAEKLAKITKGKLPSFMLANYKKQMLYRLVDEV